MNSIKTIVCLLLIVIGFIILFGGEIAVVAWCIYDIVAMLKAESVSFMSCVYLIMVRVFGGVCAAVVGIACIFAGYSGMGGLK